MSHTIGSQTRPLRVAIIGSGPAAFYAANNLLKKSEIHITVDMFDRLPTPYGLVRGGVAPDHQKIKNVICNSIIWILQFDDLHFPIFILQLAITPIGNRKPPP